MTQWSIDSAHSSVEFGVKHLGISWVKGRFSGLEGTAVFDPAHPETGSIEAVVKTKSVWTGNEARDNHLRGKDFFDAENYPVAEFKSTSIKKEHGSAYRVTGDFTLKGVTHQILLEGTYSGARKIPQGEGKKPAIRAGFSVKTAINRHDFGMSWDMPAGEGAPSVGGEVEIIINFEVVAQ